MAPKIHFKIFLLFLVCIPLHSKAAMARYETNAATGLTATISPSKISFEKKPRKSPKKAAFFKQFFGKRFAKIAASKKEKRKYNLLGIASILIAVGAVVISYAVGGIAGSVWGMLFSLIGIAIGAIGWADSNNVFCIIGTTLNSVVLLLFLAVLSIYGLIHAISP